MKLVAWLALTLALGCDKPAAEGRAESPVAETAVKRSAAPETKPVPSAGAAEPGTPVPELEGQGIVFASDGTESTIALSSRGRERPTAWVFLGTQCGTTAKYLGRIAALERQFAGKVDFVYLYPNKTDTPEQKRAFHKTNALRGPMIDDQGAQRALQLGGKRTAELVLVGKDGTIVYRGAIDDSADEASVTRKHFAIAAEEHLAGKPVSQPKTVGTA